MQKPSINQITVRLLQEEKRQIEEIINNKKDKVRDTKYMSINHFIRSAVVQLIREEKKNI